MAYRLVVDGVELPSPALEGVIITYETIWSSNAGRVASGKMTGTPVTTKWKLEVKWPVLSQSDAQKVFDAAKGGFKTVVFTDPFGNERTMTAYCGTPAATPYSWADGLRWVTGVELSIIEQ